MKRFLYILLFLFALNGAKAQVLLHTSLFGSGGISGVADGVSIESAIGEPISFSFEFEDESRIHQGLLQPTEPLVNGGKLKFYNAFSPNDDGENDTWFIENLDLFITPTDKAEVYIFNRYGLRVWASTSYDNDKEVWKGTNQRGERVPDGTYYYLAKVNGNQYKGYIEITR